MRNRKNKNDGTNSTFIVINKAPELSEEDIRRLELETLKACSQALKSIAN